MRIEKRSRYTLSAKALAASLCCASAAQNDSPARAPATIAIGEWTVSTHSNEIAAALRCSRVDAVASADPVALAQRIQAIASDKTSWLSLQTETDRQASTLGAEALSVVGSNKGDFYGQVYSALDGQPPRRAGLAAKTHVAQEAAKYNNESLTIKLAALELEEPGKAHEAKAKAEPDRLWGRRCR